MKNIKFKSPLKKISALKIFLCFSVLVFSLTLSGCGKKSESNNNENNQNEQTSTRQMPAWNENFEPGALTDLQVGLPVLVMGTESSDGSFTASQIMIGLELADFENMARPTSSAPAHINSDDNNLPDQPPSDFSNGQRPDFEQFQNMSDEERAQMREQMLAQGGTAGRFRNGGNVSMIRISGEIID